MFVCDTNRLCFYSRNRSIPDELRPFSVLSKNVYFRGNINVSCLSLTVSSWLTSNAAQLMSQWWFGRSKVKLHVHVVWFVHPADLEPSFSMIRKLAAVVPQHSLNTSSLISRSYHEDYEKRSFYLLILQVCPIKNKQCLIFTDTYVL